MSKPKYNAPTKCPVCGHDLVITKLTCGVCASEMTGEFTQNKFSLLSSKDVEFIEVFIRNRGNIKDVERELGVSYPTVRSMLDQVISNLGLIGGKEQSEDTQITKAEILDLLEQGQITSTEAVKMLKDL